jgi:hypothetical protein
MVRSERHRIRGHCLQSQHRAGQDSEQKFIHRLVLSNIDRPAMGNGLAKV